MNKKIVAKIIVIFFILMNLFSLVSFAVLNPTKDFYVNDYADILSEETERYIINTNVTLNNSTGAQVVVVTVPNLGGESLEEYATKLFREFGIGDKDKNNGVLLLLALEERKFRVEVGYGLEGALPDGKTGRIQDEYIIPYLKQNDWDNGIRNGFNAVLKEIETEYNIDIGAEEASTVSNSMTEAEEDAAFVSVGVVPITTFIVSKIIRGFRDKAKKSKLAIISIAYLIISSIIQIVILKDWTVLPAFIGMNIFVFAIGLFLTMNETFLGGGSFGGGSSRWFFTAAEAVASQEAVVLHGGGGSSRGF